MVIPLVISGLSGRLLPQPRPFALIPLARKGWIADAAILQQQRTELGSMAPMATHSFVGRK
jgi:hypothetical protein